MNLKKALLTVLGLLATLSIFGCSSPKDSAIPWSRPASWEGQVPGMGTTPGSGSR